MFFVVVTVLLVVGAVASLVLAARHRRSWRAWVPLVVVAAVALLGAAWLAGVPVLA